jgi:hypothetical protein
MADVKVPAKLHLMSKAAQKAWYKKNNMEMPKEKSAAQSGKIKPAEKKVAAPVKPKSAREISMERQKAYYAKGGRAPIGAGGSGGSSAMAGVGQSSAKEIIKGIKAGINPKVALVRYTQEQKVFETNGEYNRYGHPKAGSVDIDPTSSDKPPVYKKRPVARYKPKVEEATKQEAEKLLGGPVKEKPKMPAGKQPAEYRYVRNLARKAMKAGMKKEEVEQVDEANMRFDYEAAARPKSSDVKNFLNRDKNPRAAAASKKYIRRMTKLGGLGPNQTKKDTEAHMKAHFEEVAVDEAAKDWQKAFSGVAQKNLQKDIGKMRSKVSRLKYVGAQPKVDASPKVTAQKTQKGMYSEEMQYIEEKLTAADPASKWISDFVASDNPKFAGKSKKERINMALGAYYAATGKGKQAEELNFQEAKKMDDMEDDYEDKMKDDEEEDDMEDDDEEEKKKKVDEKYMGFKAVMASAKKGGARDPAAVAAAIGRKKYGKEKFQAAAAAGKKLGEGMDAVGREDKDIDNDGDTDKTDVYLHNKRKAIGNAIRKKLAAKLEKKDGE